MEKLDVEVARLSAQLTAGFGGVEHRLEAMGSQLNRVEQQVRLTNGRVTELETAKRVRDAMDAEAVVAEHRHRAAPAAGISQRDVTLVLAGGGAMIAAWKFAEWAFALLARVPQP